LIDEWWGRPVCDPTPVRNFLIAVGVGLGVTIAIIAGAAVANDSWWSAWTSPFGMAAAGFAALGSGGLVGLARSALDAFCACATRIACNGPCSSLRNLLTAMIATLGILATACFGAIFIAADSVVGDVAMWTISAALTVQLGLVISGGVFYDQLAKCQTTGTGQGLDGGGGGDDQPVVELAPLPDAHGTQAGGTTDPPIIEK
jgi:hypothetical protein